MSFIPITISRNFRCAINMLLILGMFMPFVFLMLLPYYYMYRPQYYYYPDTNLSATVLFGGMLGPMALTIVSFCIVSFLEKIKLVCVSCERECWCTMCSDVNHDC